MPHKLFIKYTVKVDSELSKYLGEGEVIRGEPFRVSFTIKNIANEDFPGGIIKTFKARFAGVEWTASEEQPLSTLAPAAHSVFARDLLALSSGNAWLVLGIEANDKQPIEYYQSVKAKLEGPRWESPIFVVEREWLRIEHLLEQLISKKGGKS